MEIHINSVKGGEIPVEVASSDTLSDVKQKIFDKEGIPLDDQRFVFGQSLLIDGVVVDQVNAILTKLPHLADSVQSDSTGSSHVYVTIWMDLRFRGGRAPIQRAQTHSSSSVSYSDFDDEDPEHGGGNGVSHEDEVQIQSSPFGSDHESLDCNELPQSGEKKKSLASKLSGELQIHVKTLMGREIPVEIVSSDTLSDVKQQIFDEEGTDPDEQRLLFEG